VSTLTINQLNSVRFGEDADISSGLINRYLTKPTAERVANAMVTSLLGYCNALLFGTASSNIFFIYWTITCIVVVLRNGGMCSSDASVSIRFYFPHYPIVDKYESTRKKHSFMFHSRICFNAVCQVGVICNLTLHICL